MSWQKKHLIFKALVGMAFLGLGACGVKGDPLPPEKPPEIGRGRPTYKRATEEIVKKKNSPSTPVPADDKEEDDDN